MNPTYVAHVDDDQLTSIQQVNRSVRSLSASSLFRTFLICDTIAHIAVRCDADSHHDLVALSPAQPGLTDDSIFRESELSCWNLFNSSRLFGNRSQHAYSESLEQLAPPLPPSSSSSSSKSHSADDDDDDVVVEAILDDVENLMISSTTSVRTMLNK